jgi:hypothetical protein
MFKKKITQLLRYMNNLSSKGYYSDSTLDKYISLDPYLNLYYNCIEKEKVLTNTEICFSPTIKFGSTIEFVKKNNPHEYTILQNTNDCVILLYKIKEGRYKFRLELFFFKNKLVFFTYIYRASRGKKRILDLFAKKYLKSEEHRLPDLSKITLTDGLKKHIEIDNSVFLTMHYFTFKYGFFDYLKSINKNHQIQKIKVSNLEEFLLLRRI